MWECDDEMGGLRGKGREGRPKWRWLESVRGDLREKGLSRYEKSMTEQHGGECHRTSMPHQSEEKVVWCITSELHVWYNDFLADTGEGVARLKVMFVGRPLGHRRQELDRIAHELNATHTNSS